MAPAEGVHERGAALITGDDAARLKDALLVLLAEDALNTERLTERLDRLASETGVSAHAALLLLLTGLAFEEDAARSHWESILEHRHALSLAVQREVGLRTALIDYFVNANRRLARPCLIDVSLSEPGLESGESDPLTGLAADRAFRAAVQSELRRAKRYGQRVSVALFDLDRFGAVNERGGKLVGDRVLRETAMLLHNKIRDIDLAARPAEDEFALLLPETDREGGVLVAERFRAEVEAHFRRREVAGSPAELTVSAGVAAYPDDARNPEDLLSRSAQALYRAKASGKNLVQAWRPERRRLLRCDLAGEGIEVEVLGGRDLSAARAADLSVDGILFDSPEPIDVGEEIELRLAAPGGESVRVQGRVVRLEEVPPPATPDDLGGPHRFEIGVAFSGDAAAARGHILEILERARDGKPRGWA